MTLWKRFAAAVSLWLGLVGAGGALAGDVPIGPDLVALGWQAFGFSGLRENQFIGHENGVLEVVSEESISALHFPVANLAGPFRCLAWSWRVDESVPVNDLRHRETDDRAISIFVTYPFDPESASWWERVTRVFVELARGAESPGRIVSYVWGGKGVRGDLQPSPYLQSAGGIVLLRPGVQETGIWHDECVDLAADYVRAFGAPAPSPSQIAVLSDSDSTHSRAHAFVRGLRFIEKCIDEAPAR